MKKDQLCNKGYDLEDVKLVVHFKYINEIK